MTRFLEPFKAQLADQEAHRQNKRPFLIAGRQYRKQRTYAGNLLENILAGVPEGGGGNSKGRNSTFYEFACFWLRSQGIKNISGFRTFLSGVNAEFCQPPLSENELDQIVNSALKGAWLND